MRVTEKILAKKKSDVIHSPSVRRFIRAWVKLDHCVRLRSGIGMRLLAWSRNHPIYLPVVPVVLNVLALTYYCIGPVVRIYGTCRAFLKSMGKSVVSSDAKFVDSLGQDESQERFLPDYYEVIKRNHSLGGG